MTNRPLRFVLPLVIAAIGTPALAADPVGEVRDVAKPQLHVVLGRRIGA